MLSVAKRAAPSVMLTLSTIGLLLYAIGIDGLISYYRPHGVDLRYVWLAVAFGCAALVAGLWCAHRKKGSVAIAIALFVLCLSAMSWVGLTH